MSLAHQRPLLAFFILAYTITWICWSPLVLSRTGLGILPITVPMPYVIIGTYAPLIAALLTQWLAEKNLRAFHFYSSWQRLLLGLLLGPVLIALAFVILPSLVLTKGSLTTWNWASFGSYPLGIAYNLLMAGPVGEEPGWRGYALPKLQRKFGPILGSIVLGVLWFGWHLPLFLIPSWTSSSMSGYALLVIGLSFLMTFGFNLSGGSVLVAIIMHSAFNSCSRVLGGFLEAAKTRERPSAETTLALSFLVVAILITVFTRGRLAASNKAT